jgi:thymidylate synthase (FAD)
LKVELVSHTPNPVELCGRIAGISYGKEEREGYGDFIKKLIKMGHFGVLEHAVFTFRAEGISRALTHQWVRHRVGSFLQRSQRRVDESEPNYVLPPMEYLKDKGSTATYGGKIMPVHEAASSLMRDTIESCFRAYKHLREYYQVKPEDARFVLPNATETKIYWTANARTLRHFFKLRLHKTAQWEIRELAKEMFNLVYAVAPAFFEDLRTLRETGEYSGEEGGLE